MLVSLGGTIYVEFSKEGRVSEKLSFIFGEELIYEKVIREGNCFRLRWCH